MFSVLQNDFHATTFIIQIKIFIVLALVYNLVHQVYIYDTRKDRSNINSKDAYYQILKMTFIIEILFFLLYNIYLT